MSLYPKQLLTAGWPDSGMLGVLGYTVTSTDGTIRIARTTVGIVHLGGGVYEAVTNFDTDWGGGKIVWDDGSNVAAETFEVPGASAGSGVTNVDIHETSIK